MSWSEFETTVPGKWVLAGEHAVLRGVTAIALPHPEFRLNLKFKPGGDFVVTPASAAGVVGELIQAVEDERREEGLSFAMPRGKLEILSTIPMGAGLGSSAALCVAMTRWMAESLMMGKSQYFEFATQLEHRFHGRSSGMDIAVTSAGEPISFVTGRGEQGARSLSVRKLPRFTFHDSGIRTRTSECIIRVERFREDNPTMAMKVDEGMGLASRLAMEGLVKYDAGSTADGLGLLARAMAQAQECFYSWELVPGEAKRIVDQVVRDGALAAKLTGAGGGGFVVAVWPDQR